MGCGIVGAAIAWELSRCGLSVVGVDRSWAGLGSTGAALGVLVGVAGQQTQGPAAQLRLDSLLRFDGWVGQLQDDLGCLLPVNQRGILHLLPTPEERDPWEKVLEARQQAGLDLRWIPPDDVEALQPHLMRCAGGAIYSPQDRQVDPTLLTNSLIKAAMQQGATFYFQEPVTQFKVAQDRVNAIYTPKRTISASHVVITAGLGSQELGSLLGYKIPMSPVKGQALRLHAPGIPIYPVVTARDLHLVPQFSGELSVGATVEFEDADPQATLGGIRSLIDRALEICPSLASAQLLGSWAGLRPRPRGRRAPILGFVPHLSNVLLATGHYRNGVLLAPITAAIMRELLQQGQTHLCDLSAFQPQDP